MTTNQTQEEILKEYKLLLIDIRDTEQWGESFVGAVLLSITTSGNSNSRNEYIKSMGKHFMITKSKVDRIIELLPND